MNKYVLEAADNETCGICMGVMKAAVFLPCGHPFHKFCLIQLVISGKSVCPLCKQNIDGKGLRSHRRHTRASRGSEDMALSRLDSSQGSVVSAEESFRTVSGDRIVVA